MYTDTCILAINFILSYLKPGYNLVNYQCQPGHELLIDKRHYYWARSCKLSMSQLGHDPQPEGPIILSQ